MSTYHFYAFLRWFYIPCIGYLMERLKLNTLHLSGQCNRSLEWFIKKGIWENNSLRPRYEGSLCSYSCIAP